MSKKLTVLICGGGNGAHVIAGIASAEPNIEARVLTLYADEAERWTNAMNEGDFTVTVFEGGAVTEQLKTKPTIVTKDPAKCAPGCDIIALVVPAFAHTQYLEALKPYITPNMVVVGLPGQAGFEFSILGILGDMARQCTILNYESLPYACRIKSFGQEVEVLSRKIGMDGTGNNGKVHTVDEGNAMMQRCLGKTPVLKIHGHLLGTTLMDVNAYIHPSILYGEWHNWDGNPVEVNPLFYQGLTKETAQILVGVSDEAVATAKAISKLKPDIDLSNVTTVYDYYMRCYGHDISDKTDLWSSLRTNNGYMGLRHPCKKDENGKFSPDYGHRYITEDIPFGLVPLRGIAEIVGVPTPNQDLLIKWAEKVSGKEYLVDGKVKGKDVVSTRAPQRYGINTIDGMLSF